MKLNISGGLLRGIIDGVLSTGRPEAVMMLKDNRWMIKMVDAGNVVMFACRVEHKAMETYDKGDETQIGVDFESLDDSVYSKSSKVEMEVDTTKGGSRKVIVRQNGYDAGIPLIDPEYVEGVTHNVPQLDWAVEVEGDISFIKDYVKRADKVTGQSYFMISARGDGIHLYTEKDTKDLHATFEWDQFDDYSINWEDGNYDGGQQKNPPEAKAVDTILSMEHAKSLDFMGEEGKLFLDNHVPMKLLFTGTEGVDSSYFFSPRVDKESAVLRLPSD
jgi:hypothetical protein